MRDHFFLFPLIFGGILFGGYLGYSSVSHAKLKEGEARANQSLDRLVDPFVQYGPSKNQLVKDRSTSLDNIGHGANRTATIWSIFGNKLQQESYEKPYPQMKRNHYIRNDVPKTNLVLKSDISIMDQHLVTDDLYSVLKSKDDQVKKIQGSRTKRSPDGDKRSLSDIPAWIDGVIKSAFPVLKSKDDQDQKIQGSRTKRSPDGDKRSLSEIPAWIDGVKKSAFPALQSKDDQVKKIQGSRTKRSPDGDKRSLSDIPAWIDGVIKSAFPALQSKDDQVKKIQGSRTKRSPDGDKRSLSDIPVWIDEVIKSAFPALQSKDDQVKKIQGNRTKRSPDDAKDRFYKVIGG